MGARVLMVEDDEEDRFAQSRKLRASGFTVDVARNWAEADRTNNYDAILLDVGLPDVKTDEVVALAKRTHPQAAIVVLSGNDDPDFIRHCIGQNASNYLVKGKDNNVVAIINTAINEMRALLALKQIGDAL